jgi:hypothetical protein
MPARSFPGTGADWSHTTRRSSLLVIGALCGFSSHLQRRCGDMYTSQNSKPLRLLADGLKITAS